jgi:hypothetical protein
MALGEWGRRLEGTRELAGRAMCLNQVLYPFQNPKATHSVDQTLLLSGGRNIASFAPEVGAAFEELRKVYFEGAMLAAVSRLRVLRMSQAHRVCRTGIAPPARPFDSSRSGSEASCGQ